MNDHTTAGRQGRLVEARPGVVLGIPVLAVTAWLSLALMVGAQNADESPEPDDAGKSEIPKETGAPKKEPDSTEVAGSKKGNDSKKTSDAGKKGEATKPPSVKEADDRGKPGDAAKADSARNLLREFKFARPAKPGGEAEAGDLFEALDVEHTGIDLVVPIDTEHADDRLYASAMACGAVAAGDLDGDGRVDLYFACGAVPNRLYRQGDEDFAFEDVTEDAGVGNAQAWSTGAALADVDNDGDLDIYLCCYDSPNRLYINESTPGEMNFVERSAQWGLDLIDAGLMPSFVDYDRDGDIDVFIAVNAYYRDAGRPQQRVPMQKTADGWRTLPPWDRFYAVTSIDPRTGRPEYGEVGRPNRLLANQGGLFFDISGQAGISAKPSHTNAATWWDYDGDGFLDLHVGNDFADPDELYHNNRNGTFTEVAARVFQHSTWFSMGAAATDLNNDGRVDFIAADTLPGTHYREKLSMVDGDESFAAMFERGLPHQKRVNTLLVNTGTGLFLETARISGLARTDWTWTVKSADFDGDGLADLFFPNGHSRDFNNLDLARQSSASPIGRKQWAAFEETPELRENNVAFRNAGDLLFENAGRAWGLGREKTMSCGAAVADIDNDGAPDLVVMNLNEPPGVFRNRSMEGGAAAASRVAIDLRGTRSNRFGVGAVVRIESKDGRRQMRTLTPQSGCLESDQPRLLFGLGAEASIAELSVEWPSGALQRFENLASNRRYQVTEPKVGEAGEAPPREGDENAAPLWFTATGSLGSLTAREQVFDDFARQPLLPHKHSQLGPGQAWGDVDGDGFADLYLGSPTGAAGRLLLSRGLDEKGRPKFAMRMEAPFNDPDFIECEDLGCLFLDADCDGDEDLYLVRGGVEFERGDGHYQDRLFLNSGEGDFTAAPPGALPETTVSGGVVASADFDRDGDLDLFVGGRVIPGRYPESPRSLLLVNDGEGRFSELTNKLSDDLARSGMVTAALWSDVDDDGWLDLLVTYEWGAIKVLRNRRGRSFKDVTGRAGLGQRLGMWNSIAGRDLDGDGDIDYLAGNLGLNTRYRASAKEPEVLFYGDLDGSGRKHLIEASTDGESGKLVPRRGLGPSSRVMPSLPDRVGTFHDFASRTVAQIYSPQRLSKATRLEANTLSSVALINDGSGRFRVEELPWFAQLAPVFGIVVSDFDADGWSDVLLTQNFNSPQPETGPMNGGLSVVLSGNAAATGAAANGSDRWRSLWPMESGVAITGDAKSAGYGDLNGDSRPDLIIGINDGPPRLLLNQTGIEGAAGGQPLKVRLRGSVGNRTAIGARVTLLIEGRPSQTAELYAGCGYLTQGSPELFFGLGAGTLEKITAELIVRWPDGRESSHPLTSEQMRRGSVIVSVPVDEGAP